MASRYCWKRTTTVSLLVLGLFCTAKTQATLQEETIVLEESTIVTEESTQLTFLSDTPQLQLLTPLEEYEDTPQSHSLIRGGKDNCFAIPNCTTCSSSSRCHWCQHDQKCHEVGSVYGCRKGAHCGGDAPTPTPNPHPPDSCSKYPNCVACGNTHTCHWCAKDETCHTIGSVYGCLRGVECYSQDRCRRKVAEPLPQTSFSNLGFLPMVGVTAIAALLFCCASICYCGAREMKGAYQDLFWNRQGVYGGTATTTTTINTVNGEEEVVTQPQLAAAAFVESDRELVEDEPAATEEIATTDDPESSDTNNEETAENGADQFHPALEMERPPTQDIVEEEEEPQLEQTPLLSRRASFEDLTMATTQGGQESVHMGRMHRMCTCFYLFFVLALGGGTFLAIRFYPKIPAYSVCNDSVAWTKLFESLVTLKTEADFEILMSFENANHLGIALDDGRGDFKHNGNSIGHYRIPPVDAPAMAITDVLIIATLTPGTWEAMDLAKEYYAGTLVLDIDIDLTVRTPWLFNFSTSVVVNDRPVEINRYQERHLCACKAWDGNNGTLTTDTRQDDGWNLFPFLSGVQQQ